MARGQRSADQGSRVSDANRVNFSKSVICPLSFPNGKIKLRSIQSFNYIFFKESLLVPPLRKQFTFPNQQEVLTLWNTLQSTFDLDILVHFC